MKKKLLLILPLLLVIGLAIFLYVENDNPIAPKEENSLENLTYNSNVYSNKEINKEAKKNGVKEEEVKFFCPKPKISDINECLMHTYQKEYGNNFYTGKKEPEFNQLLINYSQGKTSKKDTIEKIDSMPSWIEFGKGVELENKKQQQVLITNKVLGNFKTQSNLINEIMGEVVKNNLMVDSDYYQLLINYDDKKDENKVSVLAINLAYIDESWE